MNSNKKQQGFAHVAILILVLVVVGVVGFAGWRVYFKDGDKSTENVREELNMKQVTDTDQKSTSELLKPKECGTDSVDEYSATFDIAYTVPEGFSDQSKVASNGFEFKSLDFESENNHKAVSKGSVIDFYVMEYCTTAGNTVKDDLKNEAQLRTDSLLTEYEYIVVGDYYGIKYSHNTGENRNNHLVVLFVKGRDLYVIDQQYSLDLASNPQPSAVDELIKSIN